MTSKHVRKAILPVGGLGTRFLPATKALPKEMLPIIDRPLIHYAVQEALHAGIEEFIFITGRGKAAIEDYFDHAYELDTTLLQRHKLDELEESNAMVLQPGQIAFVRQQEPLGLGHAVWCARNFIGDEPFAVLLADDLILSDRPCLQQLIDAYAVNRGNMVAVMDIDPSETDRYGILSIKKQDTHIVQANAVVEKPKPSEAPSTLAVIGRYILDASIFDILEHQNKGAGGEIQLTDAIDAMSAMVPLFGVRFLGKRFDCGNKRGFLEATFHMALHNPETATFARQLIGDLAQTLSSQNDTEAS